MSTATAQPTARDIMTAHVYTLQAAEPVFEAAGRLLRQGHSGAPVLDGRELVGIITARDLVGALAFAIEHRASEAPVRDFMTVDLVHVGPNELLVDLCRRFADQPMRMVPVVEDDALVGVLTISDVLRALQRQALQMRRDA